MPMPGIIFLIVGITCMLISKYSVTLSVSVFVIGIVAIAHIFKDSKHEWIDNFWSGAFGFIVIAGGIGLLLGLISNI